MTFSTQAFDGQALCTVCGFGGDATIATHLIVDDRGATNGSFYCEKHARRGAEGRNAREAFLVAMGLEAAPFEVQQEAWEKMRRLPGFNTDFN